MLAEGFDKARTFEYNREAGRLLLADGDGEMAFKYLKRAAELAPDDESKAAVEAMLKEVAPSRAEPGREP